MQTAPLPANEAQRIESVKALNILDTPPEQRFDNITQTAATLFHVPISTLSIIDSQREWFKSACGIGDQKEGERAISFCGHAMLSDDIFIIPDTTKDSRFADNPMVTGKPFIRFYAGVPLYAQDGERIGVFCIKDIKPRTFSDDDSKLLKALAQWAQLELSNKDLSVSLQTISRQSAELNQFFDLSEELMMFVNKDGFIFRVNKKFEEVLGYSVDELRITPLLSLVHPEDTASTTQSFHSLGTGNNINGLKNRFKKKAGTYVWLQWDMATFEGTLFGIARDITKDLDEENRKRHYALILQYANDAIISKDLHGIVTFWNKAAEQLYGYTSEEMVGKSIKLIIPDGKLDDLDMIMNKVISGETVDHYETTRKTKNGRLVQVSLSVAPIHDYQNVIVGASVIALDITKRKEEEDKLRESYDEIKKMNDIMVGRELKMMELKGRISELEAKLQG